MNSQGSEHVINWELASSAECRQLISKFKQIEPYLEPPFVVEAVVKAGAVGGNGDEAADDDVEKAQAGLMGSPKRKA